MATILASVATVTGLIASVRKERKDKKGKWTIEQRVHYEFKKKVLKARLNALKNENKKKRSMLQILVHAMQINEA